MSKIRTLVLIFAVFSIGWLLNSVVTGFFYYDAEKPLPVGFVPFMKSPERLSPSDHISEEQIHVYSDRVVIDTEGVKWARFTDTNSMDPFFDETANSLELKPDSEEDVNPGDVISYRSGITGDLVVHRVVSKGVDEYGTFFIVKGDNNNIQDPEKVRLHQIHGVMIGIIY
ncbi:hypothetical protein HQ545_06715 [Candidatus Woesearchaeota archaeon]|nr:hypothetical protein [Candidatus Woesearchaeota archaeon]